MSSKRKAGEIESPCIRNCCLDDNDICLGCFRSLDEILSWSASTLEEKQKILSNCKVRSDTRKGQ